MILKIQIFSLLYSFIYGIIFYILLEVNQKFLYEGKIVYWIYLAYYFMGDDMDKVKEVDNGFNHGITLVERKNIVISGVKKIESFDSEEFLMETTLGYLVIKGNELEIIKLDTYQGNVSIKGKVNSFSYKETINKKEKEESVFSKLFKWFP